VPPVRPSIAEVDEQLDVLTDGRSPHPDALGDLAVRGQLLEHNFHLHCTKAHRNRPLHQPDGDLEHLGEGTIPDSTGVDGCIGREHVSSSATQQMEARPPELLAGKVVEGDVNCGQGMT
jgi:hypothetical protein